MAAALHLPYPPVPPPVPPTSARVVAFNRVSEAEYLALDAASEHRLEYVGGEVRAMAGASPNHNDIAGNTYAWLHTRLRGTPCRPRMSDQRVSMPKLGTYTYPDLVVGCGELQYQPGSNPMALLNPVLIIEVLSGSTEAYDRGRKFLAYQAIASLRYYLLIDSQQVGADLYTREPGADLWLLRHYHDLAAHLPLPALGIELPLAEVYNAVVFGEGEA